MRFMLKAATGSSPFSDSSKMSSSGPPSSDAAIEIFIRVPSE